MKNIYPIYWYAIMQKVKRDKKGITQKHLKNLIDNYLISVQKMYNYNISIYPYFNQKSLVKRWWFGIKIFLYIENDMPMWDLSSHYKYF